MRKNKATHAILALLSQRWLLINAASLLIFAGTVLAIVSAFKKNECFAVHQVIVREKDEFNAGARSVEYLKGQNIFAVNVDREAARIAQWYPSYRTVRLTRYLPDCIVIDFLRRTPAASIRAEKNCYVDGNGYLFDQLGEANLSDLPVITGLERKISRAWLGRANAIREIVFALQVINGMRQEKSLAAYRLRTINVSAPDTLAFFLFPPGGLSAGTTVAAQLKAENEAIEVRVGSDNIPAKMHILSTVLMQMRSNAANIKYIDLRFKEPVIKFKHMDKFVKN